MLFSPDRTTRTDPDKPDKPDAGEGREPGQTGHTPIGVSGMSGRLGCPVSGQGEDPAAAWRRKADRAAAWAAWEAAGEPWPPPAGLVSAALDRCQTNSSDRRWRR
jgi:hypothetical protein